MFRSIHTIIRETGAGQQVVLPTPTQVYTADDAQSQYSIGTCT
jgi:hypothetical protein